MLPAQQFARPLRRKAQSGLSGGATSQARNSGWIAPCAQSKAGSLLGDRCRPSGGLERGERPSRRGTAAAAAASASYLRPAAHSRSPAAPSSCRSSAVPVSRRGQKGKRRKDQSRRASERAKRRGQAEQAASAFFTPAGAGRATPTAPRTPRSQSLGAAFPRARCLPACLDGRSAPSPAQRRAPLAQPRPRRRRRRLQAGAGGACR